MKKLYSLLFTSILFFLTGCTLDYNLEIEENMLVKETINIMEENSFLSVVTLHKEAFINEAILEFSDTEEYVDYKYEPVLGSKWSGATVSKSFLDIYDYRNKNLLYKKSFSSIEINEENGIVDMKFISSEKNELFSSNSQELSTFNNANISIKVPFVVLSTNADSIDYENNTYTWRYNYNNYMKNIEIKFDKDKTFKKKVSVEVYIVVGIIIIFFSVMIYIYSRYKKNNKF